VHRRRPAQHDAPLADVDQAEVLADRRARQRRQLEQPRVAVIELRSGVPHTQILPASLSKLVAICTIISQDTPQASCPDV